MVPIEDSSANAESAAIKPQAQPQVSAGMLWNSKEHFVFLVLIFSKL